jgi:GTP pyrophosphokinase
MLVQVGYGKCSLDDAVGAIAPPESKAPPEITENVLEKVVRKVTGKDSAGILVSGHSDILVRFAKCCTPLPGDEIVGFISRGRGITVHRRSCDKGREADLERKVNVDWKSGAKVPRSVCLRVITANRPGILAEVGNTFSKCGMNIEEANCRAAERDRATNLFSFTVADLSSLKNVIRALQKLNGVLSVERV